ncbi:MAG TPA: acyl-CoA desaturase [Ideonella sp.]|nr:acyl-CoA desaturase [Ideonella sp.]
MEPITPPARPRGALGSSRLFDGQFRVAFLTVVLPALAFAGGLFYALGAGVSLFYLGLWAAMHFIGMAGISVGFHRLASHSSFKGTHWTRRALMIMGSMSAQGPVLYWASNHRRHHHLCDRAGDVHSPYYSERGEHYESALAGLWHAHTGWMFKSNPTNPIRYSLDLLRDADAVYVNRHYYRWVALGIVLPGVIAGGVFQTAGSVLLGALIGGGMRIFTVQHVTWAINSLTHMFGRRPYRNGDHSSNLLWLSLPTTGESWHNNHHAFPYSARLGLEWWQLDPGWWLLVVLRRLGLVWDLKLPTVESKAAKRAGDRPLAPSASNADPA